MPDVPQMYKKVTGRGMGSLGFARLWSGPDHLLEVTTYGVSERYRRFYWKEIEAVLVCRNSVQLISNLISGALLLLSVAGVLVGIHYFDLIEESALQGLIVFGIGLCGLLGSACLLVLFINTLFGPRCVCLIKTRLGMERLAAPRRLREALRLIEAITPFIEAAQSEKAAELPT